MKILYPNAHVVDLVLIAWLFSEENFNLSFSNKKQETPAFYYDVMVGQEWYNFLQKELGFFVTEVIIKERNFNGIVTENIL